MKKVLFLVLVLALAAASLGAVAQNAPGGTTTKPGGNANSNGIGAMMRGTVLYTDMGLFALRGGVLLKIDPKTMQVQGDALELFGPAPKFPEKTYQEDPGAFTAYYAEVNQRLAPAIMLVKDRMLLVVIGTKFVRVNMDTMKIEVNRDFRNDNDTDPGPVGVSAVPLAYELHGKTLYLLRLREMVALNTDDGANVHTPLPELMIKQLNPYQKPN